MDRRYDLAIALVLFALGIFVISVTSTIPIGFYRDALGPRVFYFGIGIVFMVAGFTVALNYLRRWKSHKDHMVLMEGTADEEGQPSSAFRAAIIMGLSIIYAALWNLFGYLLSTPLYIASTLLVLKERNWKWISIWAVGFTVIFYIVFAQFLHLRVSVGPFTSLFRDLGWIIF